MEHVTAILGGSGLAAFNDDAVVERLLRLVPAARAAADGRCVEVAYLGTATYDLPEPQEKQSGGLARRGCHVRAICVADPAVTELAADDAVYLREAADVVLVSGGNTLYAVDRWERLGLDVLLREVAGRGQHGGAARRVVLAGGSAGAICWFTAGHSDSADPTTYRPAMLAKAAAQAPAQAESAQPEQQQQQGTAEGTWSYIRVHALDILPGLMCPHYDIAQGDRAVRREVDFSAMLQRHPSERGVALDHWAVLVLPGDGSYEVFAVPGHPTRQSGSDDGDVAPGLYLLDVSQDEAHAVQRRRVAAVGRVEDLFRPPIRGTTVADPLEAACSAANPSH